MGDGGAEVLDEGVDALEGAEVRCAAKLRVNRCCHCDGVSEVGVGGVVLEFEPAFWRRRLDSYAIEALWIRIRIRDPGGG